MTQRENIRPLENGGEENPIFDVPVFRWENPDRLPWNDEAQVGLICRTFEGIMPEALVRPGPEVDSVEECGGDQSVVVAYLVAAVQYLKAQLDEVKERPTE